MQLEHAKVGALLAGDRARRALFCDSPEQGAQGVLEVRRTLHLQAGGAIAADELRQWLRAPRPADAPLRVVVNEGAGPYLARPCQMGADAVVEDLGELFGRELEGVAFVGARSSGGLDRFMGALRIGGQGSRPCPCDGLIGSEESFATDGIERLLTSLLPQLSLISQARCDRAQVAAQYLAHHPRVSCVRYPGLQDDPANAEARRSLEHGFGWRVAFWLTCDACGFAHGLWEGPTGSFGSHVERCGDGAYVLHAGLEEPLDVVGALEKGIAPCDEPDSRA